MSKVERLNGSVVGVNNQPTTAVANGIWSIRDLSIFVSNNSWPGAPAAGQQAYTTAGTYSWVCPTGVNTVSVVCVGGGGGSNANPNAASGAGGGGLGYRNSISVVPGNSYTVVVGANPVNANGGDSYFINTNTVAGFGGLSGSQRLGGSFIGDGGGRGGNGGVIQSNAIAGGGGGAGGYSGRGGFGGGATAMWPSNNGENGAGGGGGGGGVGRPFVNGGPGGGVGILGEGSSGTGGIAAVSPAPAGGAGTAGSGGSGVLYGGGATGGDRVSGTVTIAGGVGAVRIIWPGVFRRFPATRTADE